MCEKLDLAGYIPEGKKGEKIKLWEYLAPVVGRISQILPPPKVWGFFSSTPGETGGEIVFPYSRVDSLLIESRDYIYLLTNYENSQRKTEKYYAAASLSAFRALVWVEIGFQGLENLAKSRASVNWTSGVGHFVNDEERAIGIVTRGAKLYKDCLGDFVKFRSQQGITTDCFTEYRVEYLLDPFRTKRAASQ